jgi:drug/metabolite transporter (DMT)-like permease
MIHLVLVSLIWAFSFGIIGNTLAPVPSPLVSAIRLMLAFLLFAPFFKRMAWRGALFFVFLGGVQFGAMYLCYNESFKHLESHQVALLTLTTPIFIALLEGFRARKISARLWLSVWVATLGVGIIVWHPGGFSRPPLLGLLLIQLSNLCFAFGQWAYRNRVKDAADRPAFSWMYLGAALVALPFAWQHRQLATELETGQIFALLYLGSAKGSGATSSAAKQARGSATHGSPRPTRARSCPSPTASTGTGCTSTSSGKASSGPA